MTARRQLPNRRETETMKLRFGGQNAAYHVTCGYFPGQNGARGPLGEIFISTSKIGSSADALARDIAILISLALQHGCSVETMRGAITREGNGEPSTIAGAVLDKLGERL